MAKCKDIYILKKYISTIKTEDPNNTTIGKSIFRFDSGLVCTVFDNGTVQFQGAKDDAVMNAIQIEVNRINTVY